MPTDGSVDAGGLARLRLLQLASPSLPVGAFSYSQGLEWAVEAGWVDSAAGLSEWLESTLRATVAPTDLPFLRRLHGAAGGGDLEALATLTDEWLAWRETAELRAEEVNKGRALAALLRDLGVAGFEPCAGTAARSFLTAYACAVAAWQIPLGPAAEAYLWGWLENQVISAVKLVPLGQTDGQKTLHRLAALLPALAAEGLALEDDDLGGGSPALAIASARHETQYTRLYRS